MKRTIFFSLIFIIILIIFVSFFWLYEVQFKVGRASVTSLSFSIDNSYIFITPLRAKANSQEKIRLTVFLLNNQGLGVAGKKVGVGSGSSLTTEAIQGMTDSFGKAIFDISSVKPGEFFLEVTAEQVVLKDKAHLSFY